MLEDVCMKIQNVRIRNFKNIDEVSINLDDLNLLIGGNNAGKTSFIQALHFTIASLRSARIHGKSASLPATTLGVNQFTFLPTHQIMKIAHKVPMTQSSGPKFDFSYITNDGEEKEFELSLYRGKNSNISLKFPKSNPFFDAAADVEKPFSVFVPGLAGIPLSEERRANSIVQSGIAQGDANLFLRNVLHRLNGIPEKKSALLKLMRSIFSGFDFDTTFNEDVNQYIEARVFLNKCWTPIEMSGTGCLQALQLATYVILYEPELLLLDEPDAHLHPGNQKLLIELLSNLSENSGTQIVLASHSRHVFDSINNNPLGTIHWFCEGRIVQDQNVDLGLLLDLGALDRYEKLKSDEAKILVLTEDQKTEKLRIILEANEINLADCHFLSYNGVDNLEATQIVCDYFLSLSEETKVIIYRDGDCMTPTERSWVLDKYNKNIPERTKMIISTLTDIEHPFCLPEHISKIYDIEYQVAYDLVQKVVNTNQAILSSKFTRKREDLKYKTLKKFAEKSSTESIIQDGLSFEYSLGKLLLPKIEEEIKESGYEFRSLLAPSEALKIDELNGFEA